MNTTSTHDTKRSEDIRARISVLSEIPDEWQKHLAQWQQWHQTTKLKVNGLPVPEPNTEILLYQTLLGAWPLSTEDVPDFKARLKAYMIKAVRQAKFHTSWLKINQPYEDALISFIDAILQDAAHNSFLPDFREFQANIAFYGALNSLSQVLLKATLPGVPDFYQGTELWDFSLADPDNRRPVDFKKRRALLNKLMSQEARGKLPLIDALLSSWKDGRLKMYTTYQALRTRRDYHALFAEGDYVPLKAHGRKANQVCAFARRHGHQWALIATPRFFTKLSGLNRFPPGTPAWGDDYLTLPEDSPPGWHNIFTSETIMVNPEERNLALSDLFGRFPVALLVNK